MCKENGGALKVVLQKAGDSRRILVQGKGGKSFPASLENVKVMGNHVNMAVVSLALMGPS